MKFDEWEPSCGPEAFDSLVEKFVKILIGNCRNSGRHLQKNLFHLHLVSVPDSLISQLLQITPR
jgi:hypothetical protein